METFTAARPFAEDPDYARRRHETLAELDLDDVDPPIVDVVVGFDTLPHCFTLQCCFGHFVWAPGQDEHNLEPLPREALAAVTYRIAYVAVCIEDSPRGRALRRSLARLATLDPAYIQFGSAGWFWERWVNSWVLQVEPAVQRLKDQATLEYAEALHTEKVRGLFFDELRALLAAELGERRES
jgi:hypothetical protein